MTAINKPALRAAVAIHEQMVEDKRHDVSLYLPEYSWYRVQRLQRQIELARQHHWRRAVAHLTEDLASTLGDCRLEVESALRALQSRPTKRPVSSASDIYRDILALSDEFEDVKIDMDAHELSVTTDCIELEHVTLGDFRIRLDWQLIDNSAQPYRIVALDPNPAATRSDVTHPHIQDEQLCEGEGRAAIRAALAGCRLHDFFMLVSQLLHTYGRGSGYVELDNWDGASCADCGDSMSHDDAYGCQRCGSEVCDDCRQLCGTCEESFCSGCLDRCSKCDIKFCSSCLAKCPVCGKEFCEDCREDDLCHSCHQDQSNEESENDLSENTRNEPVTAEA